ncbi:MAG: glycosyltransferase family 39 protein [Bryobacteraceae bacterium]
MRAGSGGSFEKFAPFLPVLLTMLLYFALATPGVDPITTDWAMYAMHARNIATGHAYADTFYVYQPEVAATGGATYPSGYPLLLAPVYAIFGMKILAFKIVTDLALSLSLWPIYLFFRRYLGLAQSLLLTTALGFSAAYLTLQDKLGSDALYQLVSFATLVFVIRVFESGRDVSSPWRAGALAGLLLAAVEITRPVGLSLAFAVLAYDALNRRRPNRFAFALLAAFIPVLVLNSLLAHKDSSYAEQFDFSIGHAAHNVVAYVAGFSDVFANPFSHKLRYALWAVFTPLAIFGFATSLRKVNPVPALYAALMLGVLAIYWTPNMRYLAPLYPIYLLFAALGWRRFMLATPAQWKRPAQAAAIAGLLAAPLLSVAAIRPNPDTLITDPNFTQLVGYVRANAAPRDLIVFWNARVLGLAADRPSSAYPSASPIYEDSSPEKVLRYLDRVRPSYVVLDGGFPQDERYLAEAIAMAPARFNTVYQNARFRLMQYQANASAN